MNVENIDMQCAGICGGAEDMAQEARYA